MSCSFRYLASEFPTVLYRSTNSISFVHGSALLRTYLSSVFSQARHPRASQSVCPPSRPSDAAFPARAIDNPDIRIPNSRFKMWTLLLLALASTAFGQETCLTSTMEPYVLFGTKTAYHLANRQLYNLRPQDIPECEPVAIWLLNRFGAQNAQASELPQLQRLADLKDNVISNLRDTSRHQLRMCPADVTQLGRWTWKPAHTLKYAGDLTSSGYSQTQQLGQAWRGRYPRLFTSNPYDYVFKHMNDKLSMDSAKAFSEGLFGAQAETLTFATESDEKLIRPFETCPAWVRDVENNNSTLNQRNIFESKEEFNEMLHNISRRLGFNFVLDRPLVQRMYQMCRYNKAWDVNQFPAWCAPFSREDLRRFEYAEDLETYYKYGYGLSSQKGEKLGCTQIKDFMKFFRKHVDQVDPQQPRVSVQLAEYPALLALVAALGSRRGAAPLTGDNYHTLPVQSRQWSASSMVPYSANIAAVLYKCNTNGNFGVRDRYQVLFLQNEQPMVIPNCKTGLCEWSYVNTLFGGIADKCNVDGICSGATSLNSIVALSLALSVFLFSYLM